MWQELKTIGSCKLIPLGAASSVVACVAASGVTIATSVGVLVVACAPQRGARDAVLTGSSGSAADARSDVVHLELANGVVSVNICLMATGGRVECVIQG